MLVFLSSCSWYGNTFGKDDPYCPVGACDENDAAGDKSGDESWYCYGVQKDRSWDCGSEEQPEKIVSIDPSAVRSSPPPTELPAMIETESDKEGLSIIELLPSEENPQEILPPAEQKPMQETATVTSAGSEQGGTYILGQPAEAYTVQLIAMQVEGSMLDYASHNGIGAPLYARIQSNDSEWYVLLLGTYSDRQSAEEAKDSWESTRTLKIKPWVRKLGPLQDAIRLARTQ